MKKAVKDHKRIIILLAAASFYFLSVDILADAALFSRIDASFFVVIRTLYLLAMSAGFFSFRYLPGSKRALIILAVISVISMISTALSSGAVLVVSVLISLYCGGLVGAATYGLVALNIRNESNTGMLCAGSMGIAAILQVAASMLPISQLVYSLVLSAAVVLSTFIACDVLKTMPELSGPETESSEPCQAPPEWKLPDIRLFLLGVAVISFMGGLNDGVLTEMQTSGALNLYALPRLFYFAGMLLAGYTADRYKLRGLSVLTLFVMICAAVGALFISSPATIFINAAIYSLFAGIVIIYFTVPLFKTVTKENASYHPALGRAVRLPALAAGILIYDGIFAGRSFYLTIAAYILLSAALTVVFIVSAQRGSAGAKPVQITSDEAFAEMQSRFGLTPKETEVLRELINSDDKQEGIAERLNISVNTLRHHITSIYEKTGVYSRSALLELYYGITRQ